jgi:hypothetical protein
MVWSDVYQGYVHRMVFEDHFILKHDPADISTYGAKWRGVYVEATPRALDEACNRTSMMADVRDIKLGKLKITGSKFFDKYREKIIEHINATPLESRLFVDYARDDETSNIISEAGHMVICDKWMVRHVFSAYMDDTLPPEFVAFLFKIV